MNSGGKVAVESVPDPQLPDSRGAIVAVDAAAICGSDLHTYLHDLLFGVVRSCSHLLGGERPDRLDEHLLLVCGCEVEEVTARGAA